MADGTPGNGLVRALLLGLLAGAIILALLVAAYEIGRHQGDDGAESVQTRSAPAPAGTTTAPRRPAASGAAVVATGRELFASGGCSGCHSLDGSPGVGPTLTGLAGSRVALVDGRQATADNAYLAEAIRQPDARVVEGYSAGGMPDLGLGDEEIAALVAFLRSQ